MKNKPKKTCFSCEKEVDPEADICHGCGKLVCIDCVVEYGHIGFDGEHGKMRKGK